MTIQVTGIHASSAFDSHLEKLVSARFASRLFAKDATLWGAAAEEEATVRLGWTDFESSAAALISQISSLREEFAALRVDRFVLCGMGGSSLAAKVIAPNLTVIDSTHPEVVREALSGDLSRTAVVLSSKSGSTVEVLCYQAAFEAAFTEAGIRPADRMLVVTDPGSALEKAATGAGMRCILADPNVGGRFSALTAYGIVPSVLAGADFETLVRDAASARQYLCEDDVSNPALVFAAAIAAGAPERFLLSLNVDSSLPAHFGLWVEQLVAESTGKDGRGVLPVAGGTPLPDGVYEFAAVQQLNISANLEPAEPSQTVTVTGTLGEQILLWEVMTTALGFLLEVDPFNQPDVEAAKVEARERLTGARAPEQHVPDAEALFAELRENASGNSYLMIQAYADTGNASLAALLEMLRIKLSSDLGLPVVLGWGPRYLHSTGQIHKGGPAAGVYLQFTDTGFEDLDIPGNGSSFGALLHAQAQGDAAVLRGRGRPVVTVATDSLESYLRTLLTE